MKSRPVLRLLRWPGELNVYGTADGEGGGGGPPTRSQEDRTANQIISLSKRASIRDVFPGQYLDSTLDQIRDNAAAGDKAARTALKLLTDKRFSK